MKAVRACGSALAFWFMASSLWAGEARLAEGSGPDRVVIEASDASVEDILAILAARFEFAVERPAADASGQPVRFSGRLQGSLDEVLERLLRHEGHMIVRSAEARSGISLVRLIEAKGGGMPSPSVAGPIAAIKAKLQLRERDEGIK
jgi:hypothetical protein